MKGSRTNERIITLIIVEFVIQKMVENAKNCLADMNLVNRVSLRQCTKCLERYMKCDYYVIRFDFLGSPKFSVFVALSDV